MRKAFSLKLFIAVFALVLGAFLSSCGGGGGSFSAGADISAGGSGSVGGGTGGGTGGSGGGSGGGSTGSSNQGLLLSLVNTVDNTTTSLFCQLVPGILNNLTGGLVVNVANPVKDVLYILVGNRLIQCSPQVGIIHNTVQILDNLTCSLLGYPTNSGVVGDVLESLFYHPEQSAVICNGQQGGLISTLLGTADRILLGVTKTSLLQGLGISDNTLTLHCSQTLPYWCLWEQCRVLLEAKLMSNL
jgi:hypothetical protein